MRVLKIKQGEDRPCWEKVWFNIGEVIQKRSVCLFYQVGAVIAKGSQLLSMGYNGPPQGIEHCNKVGCAKIVKGVEKKHQGLCRGAHAEMNAIANAASLGINISGADLFVTYRPCAACAKTIINAKIKRVFYLRDYDGDQVAFDYFKKSQVKINKIVFIK
jgi:dCMP deaminase